MKEASKRFRRACRVECAKQRFDMRQKILGARSENVALFHKLINKQRGRLSNCIDELHVGDSVYKTDSGILNGWFEHFRALVASEDCITQNYHKLVQQEFPEIKDVCKWDLENFDPITRDELEKAVSKLNHGKAAYVMGITVEHFIFSDEAYIDILLAILNDILEKGSIIDCMKVGLLTPVFF